MKFRVFASDRSGSAAILFAILVVPLLGIAGVAVDYSYWQHQRSEALAAADAAALAGATAMSQAIIEGHDNTAETNAIEKAENFLHSKLDVTTGIAATASLATGLVNVKASVPAPRFLSKLFASEAFSIGVESEAYAETSTAARACIIALDPAGVKGIDLNLSGGVVAKNCAIWSNSTSATSIDANGSGSVTASATCAVGQISGVGFSFTPSAKQNCAPVTDPLLLWVPPLASTCTFTNFPIPNSGSVTLSPGVYCGGITASGQVSLLLSPGDYVLRDGGLSLSGGASIEGNGVSILLSGTGSSIDLSGSSTVSLTARLSGPMAGLVFASGRGEAIQTSRIRGNTKFFLEGNVYLPRHDLIFAGGPKSDIPENFTVLIARTITFDGSSLLEVNGDFPNAKMPAYLGNAVQATARLTK